MKIYAVTKGQYSDYHICALTTSKSNAERLRVLYSNDWDDAVIEEFEDGEGEDLRRLWFYDKERDYASVRDYPEEEQVCTCLGVIVGAYVYAKGKKHAEKKARDMIAEYKAKKDWIVIL